MLHSRALKKSISAPNHSNHSVQKSASKRCSVSFIVRGRMPSKFSLGFNHNLFLASKIADTTVKAPPLKQQPFASLRSIHVSVAEKQGACRALRVCRAASHQGDWGSDFPPREQRYLERLQREPLHAAGGGLHRPWPPEDRARESGGGGGAGTGSGPIRRLRELLEAAQRSQRLSALWLAIELLTNVVSLFLYVWSTYESYPTGAAVRILDAACSVVFALHYAATLALASSVWRSFTSPTMLLDPFTWAPSLLDLFTSGSQLEGVPDLRWMRVFRSLRILRVGLISGPNLRLSRSGKLFEQFLSGINWVLFQIVASTFVLLFTCASIIQAIEKIPWHDAFYFIVTTFTTVGFGDFIPTTAWSRIAVCAMMLVGIVVIPVRASQLYSQLQRLKQVVGPMPAPSQPFVLVSTRLGEVSTFKDFFAEFFHELHVSDLSSSARMVCLSDIKPSVEFKAFQELNEKNFTFMEGSGLNETDLIRAGAERSSAILLLGDRFNSNIHNEDLRILFQVWAIKSYTKSVPLYVQALQEETLDRIAPFLDADQDVVVSVEKFRFSTLALNCICPGASTLIGNLLRHADVPHAASGEEELAKRRWLREYANGCAYSVFQAPLGDSLVGHQFLDVSACVFRASGCTIVGVVFPDDGVLLNPGSLRIRPGDKALVLARSLEEAKSALATTYVKPTRAEYWEAISQDTETASGFEPADAVASEKAHDFEECDSYESLQSKSGTSLGDSTVDEMTAEHSAGSGGLMDTLRSDLLSFYSFGYDPEAPTLEKETANSADTQSTRKGSLSSRETVGPTEPPSGKGRMYMVSSFGSLLSANSQRCMSLDIWSAAETGPLRADATKHSSIRVSASRPERTPAVVSQVATKDLRRHIILCGCHSSMPGFMRALRRCDPTATLPLVVVVSPEKPHSNIWESLSSLCRVTHVSGTPSDAVVLKSVNSSSARAVVHLSYSQRPFGYSYGPGWNNESAQVDKSGISSDGSNSGNEVLGDADALLVCYGVGEEDYQQELVHTVVELCFTSSVKFLQPGLLLRGHHAASGISSPGLPRQSWVMRKLQEQCVIDEGMAAWQANPYYASGRVTVPAVIDTFSCECFFNNGLMVDFLTELSGDDGRLCGALLRQTSVPRILVGARYSELFSFFVLEWKLVPIGLYRRKVENPAWRLPYVATNPSPDTCVRASDRVFYLQARPAKCN